jgi:hypothetical protein
MHYGIFVSAQAIQTSAMQLRATSLGTAEVYFDIGKTGNVGIGTSAAATGGASLTVKRSVGRGQVLLETAGGASQSADLTFLKTAAVNYTFGVGASGILRMTDGSSSDTGTKMLTALSGVGLGIGGDPQGGAQGNGPIFIANATTIPASNPTGGGFLFVQAGALKYRGSSGTVTTIAAA